MWYDNENGDAVRPAEIDATSSRVYVYVRRNITLVPESQDGEDGTIPAHYKWQEMKLPKEVIGLLTQQMEHQSALDDVYDALAELAGMIVGEV